MRADEPAHSTAMFIVCAECYGTCVLNWSTYCEAQSILCVSSGKIKSIGAHSVSPQADQQGATAVWCMCGAVRAVCAGGVASATSVCSTGTAIDADMRTPPGVGGGELGQNAEECTGKRAMRAIFCKRCCWWCARV